VMGVAAAGIEGSTSLQSAHPGIRRDERIFWKGRLTPHP
jgi:hypothetical protein